MSEPSAEKPCLVSLHPTHTMVPPGAVLEVGIQLRLAPKWHAYWHSPRDGGLGPKVTWELPEGFSASEVVWPEPIRFTEYETMVVYGYADQAVLGVQIQTPKNWDKPVKLKGKVWWQACAEICVFGEATVECEIRPGPYQESAEGKLLEYWRMRFPRPMPEQIRLRQSFERSGENAEWRVAWSQQQEFEEWKLVHLFPFDLKEGGISEAKVDLSREGGECRVDAIFKLDHLNDNFSQRWLSALVVLEAPTAASTEKSTAKPAAHVGNSPKRISFLIRGSKMLDASGSSVGVTAEEKKQK